MPERFVRLPARLPAWLALALFGVGLAAAAWRQPAPPAAELAAAPVVSLPVADLPPAARTSAQRASLTRLADGRLAAAWLDEGAAETAAIRLAVRDNQGWREVGRIATRESTAAAAFMHARRLDPADRLRTTGAASHPRPTGWAAPGAGASIMHSVSTDGGRSWQRTRRLESGPFGGLGSRLGDIPRPLADGGVLLPLEEDGREGPWLRLAATGHLVGQPRQLPSAAPAP